MKKAQWILIILAAVTTTGCCIASQPETDALSTAAALNDINEETAKVKQ